MNILIHYSNITISELKLTIFNTKLLDTITDLFMW